MKIGERITQSLGERQIVEITRLGYRTYMGVVGSDDLVSVIIRPSMRKLINEFWDVIDSHGWTEPQHV